MREAGQIIPANCRLPIRREIIRLISADDETFAQWVRAKTSYDKSDIVWATRFRDMYLADADRIAIGCTISMASTRL